MMNISEFDTKFSHLIQRFARTEKISFSTAFEDIYQDYIDTGCPENYEKHIRSNWLGEFVDWEENL